MPERTRATWPLIALMALLSGLIAAEAALAKGAGQMAAPAGVTVEGSPYRYKTIAPRTEEGVTVLVRVDRKGGRVSRWWQLPGGYRIPAVAYDLSGGGLSADGSTLVLSRSSRTYPPPISKFAILDTGRRLRRPWDLPEHRPGDAVTRIALRGDFSFDAISPDGSTAYLIHHLPRFRGPDYIANYEVRALDVESGELLPDPIVDPSEPDERMEGLPITRASSPGGRWAYTLYDGNGGVPFIHALDTVGRRAVCVDLPQLDGHVNRFMLRLRTEDGGGSLHVYDDPATEAASRPILAVDTASFEVSEANRDAQRESTGAPWLPLGISAIALIATIGWIARRGGARWGKRLDSA